MSMLTTTTAATVTTTTLYAQEYVRKELGEGAEEKPCFFVFHGGSGSSEEEIKTAVGHGVVKMNVDTDTQWYVHKRCCIAHSSLAASSTSPRAAVVQLLLNRA
eukprot:19446-Heterococcus_DN1.PRE.1